MTHNEPYAPADRALRASEEKYRQIFDSIDVGFCVIELLFDPDGRPVDYLHLEANAAHARLTGLGNTVGKRALEVMPNVEPHWVELFVGVLATGEPARLEQHAAPLARWFDVHASRVGDEASRKVAVVFTNTTDRKRHEANVSFLNELSEDLAALTNIDDALNTFGARIGAHFRAAHCVFSHVDEARGLLRGEHEWHREGVASLKGVYRIEDYYDDEYRRSCRAGETYVVRSPSDPRVNAASYAAIGIGAAISVPLVRDGEWQFNLGLTDSAPRDWRDDEVELLRELTTRIWNRLERVRAELALRDADRQKDAFIATLSHELRNPVAAIMSAGTLLADPSTPADQRAFAAGVVVRQSKTASRLLDDLLDHSRIALGRFELDKQPSVSVRSVVDAALETTQRLVDAANLTVTVTVTPRSLAVDADPGRLSQVVANLVANASHHSEPNQSITIHASVVAGSVELTVRDEGAGISPAEIGQMFEMFRQGSDESKRARSGMGIGLALARRIVELHGGSISAHSEGLGSGSTFRVVLPGAATAPAAREEPTISSGPRPGRILVIDDDEDLLATFTAVLSALGYDAHTACGGVTGIAEAERLRPELILLDIGMPGLDGFEVAARIRSTAWGAAITLIALSGWGQENDKERARAAGFDDHVTKPFDLDQIRPKVDAFLARSRATST